MIGALLPIVVVLLLGFFSGWHKDFNGDLAAALNRMVMLIPIFDSIPLDGRTAASSDPDRCPEKR